MPDFFDIVAPVYEMMHLGAKKAFRDIEDLASFNKTDVVLDVGGGTGRIAKFLANKVKSITVIDPSKKMIEQCQKHTGIFCVPGRGENLPFENNSIDKIILVDALHHIKEQMKTIQEMARVLKRGGLVVVGEFNPATMGGKFIVIVENMLGFKSVFYRPLELGKLFMDKGFDVKIIDNGKTSYYVKAKKL